MYWSINTFTFKVSNNKIERNSLKNVKKINFIMKIIFM